MKCVAADPMFEALIRADCFVHNLKPRIWDLSHPSLSLHVHRGVLFTQPDSPAWV